MPGYAFYLGGGLRQLGIFIVRCNAVADEQQAAVPLLFRRRCSAQDAERAGIGNGDIFDPIVKLGLRGVWRGQFGLGHQKRFKIQVVQASIGNDENLCILL